MYPWKTTGIFESSMKVLTASTLGFCGGVKRAVYLASRALEKAARENRKLYFYGSLVHNASVCRPFSEYGAVVTEKADEVEERSIVVIRAHGITDSERHILVEKSVTLIDATCPVVAHSQALVRSSVLPVLIFGYPGHSEVDSLLGSTGDSASYVISSEKDFERIEKVEYNCVVQTTFSASLAETLLEKAGEDGIRIRMLNRICSASEERRRAVTDLYDAVDGFVVVGDEISANSRELFNIARGSGKPCFLVRDAESLPAEVFSLGTVGLTAGASTSDDVYLRVKRKLEE